MAECNVQNSCICSECQEIYERGNENCDPVKISFIKRLVAAGILRFAGWWSVFAGLLAINSVCPVCGSTACPIGLGTTGVIAVFFAAVKQWGRRFFQSLCVYIFQICRKNSLISKDAD